MKVDIFTREQMARAYEQSLGLPMFLYSTLWGNSQSQKIVTADVKVMVDKINKSRYLAGYTEHQEPARIISKAGYSTDEFQPPFINESVAFNYTHASKRPAGVTPFGTHGVKTGVDELVRNTRELRSRWLRTVEYQCASALFTGKITAGDKIFDFGLKDTHKVDLTTKWTSDTTDPFKDLDDIIALNEEESGTPTNMVIMSITAWQAFRNNKKVMAMMGSPASSRWISFGNLNAPSYNPAMQASLKGALELTEATVEIWVYGGRYFDGTETKRYAPDGWIWVGSKETRYDQYFTGFFDAEYLDMVQAEYMLDQLKETNPDQVITRLRSCPLMVPIDIDSYSVVKVA
jgi:hypothetical protein